MQLIDEPTRVLDDLAAGILWTYPQLARVPNTRGFYWPQHDEQLVPLIGGGGSGHDPAHWGYVGQGMLAAAVMGEMFVPPTADDIVAVTRVVAKQHRVFFIVKNFVADVTSFTAAKTRLEAAGYEVGMTIVADDISVEGPALATRKRGVAGTILVHKVLGAAAAAGASVPELTALAQQLAPCIKTIGFSLAGAVVPGQEAPSFTLPPHSVAYGVGIHGEPGYRTEPFQSAELLARELITKLRQAFRWQAGEQYAVLVNSLGGTTVMENLVFNRDVRELLALQPITVAFNHVGNFMSANGMHGLSLTLMRLADPAWLTALQAPVAVPAW